MVGELCIDHFKVGNNGRAFIIAEAGVNHDGDLDKAHLLIDAAADAGADAIKFQTWVTELLCVPGAKKADYQKQGAIGEDQFDMLKRLELPFDWHPELQEHAAQRNLVFLSTPDDMESARFLVSLGVPVIKVGSAELNNHSFLWDLALLGKPLILSTGMATGPEVGAAVSTLRACKPNLPFALLHCVSAYPAPENELNLRCIQNLRKNFHVPVGFSDHTMGDAAALVAAGLGMDILEKHLTLDRTASGPDHYASADPQQFERLVNNIRAAEQMLGDGEKRVAAAEMDARRTVRRVVFYARDLSGGHILSPSDLIALRSGEFGLGPEQLPTLEGRVLSRSVNKTTPVLPEDLV